MKLQDIKIKGFIPLSMLDWPGKICSVIFLAGCNFRCPFCHNHRLVVGYDSIPDFPLDEMVAYLRNRKGWIDGVTVTGGEPTVNPNLLELLQLIKRLEFSVKLDTNGSNPAVLEKLLNTNLISAISMDIKAPLDNESYSRVAGINADVSKIRRSIQVIKKSGVEYFFRTTVCPGLVAESELKEIKNLIGDDVPYILQPFRNLNTLDPKLSDLPEFELERFESMQEEFETRFFT
ncbi:MAG: anaerobic ribonucleoside-triphosphate reductase activating protein [Desulfomonilaceae bacterium]